MNTAIFVADPPLQTRDSSQGRGIQPGVGDPTRGEESKQGRGIQAGERGREGSYQRLGIHSESNQGLGIHSGSSQGSPGYTDQTCGPSLLGTFPFRDLPC